MKKRNWLINLSIIILLWFSLAFACNNNNSRTPTSRSTRDNATRDDTSSPMTMQRGVGKPYGARDPRTCADTKSPTSGAITAAQAEQYVICKKEGIGYGETLRLVENVRVTLGESRPYSPTDDYDSIDINAPVYPIRGSFDSYQCSEISEVSPKGENCNIWHEPKASGVCYITTFGDWDCNMEDNSSSMNPNGVPPPR